MSLKGRIDPDHIPLNKFEFAMVGLSAPLNPTKCSGPEQENAVINLPDRTRAAGGQISAVELVIEIPIHHTSAIDAADTWWGEGQDPIVATYKKAGTLTYTSGTGAIIRQYALTGGWISKRKLPDVDWNDDGNMGVAIYTIQVDICERIA